MNAPTPTRPALRWHGGKWLLAPWIIAQFPPHRIYTEPFGGGASVLMRKQRSYAEVYNDLDDELVTLFRVMQSDRADRLVKSLKLTPFARSEFENAYEIAEDPVEIARRLIVRSFMGFGSGLAICRRSTGFRADSNKSGSTPARDWANYPNALRALIERMRGVVIEQKPAVEILRKHDGPETLHYVDPPYVHDTRSSKREGGTLHHRYAHELTDADHEELLSTLCALEGMVALSGYDHPLYAERLVGWRRIERQTHAAGARPRTEVLWLNYPENMGRLL